MAQQVLALANGEQIPYLLERRQRRTIGMKITAQQGLVVHAPSRISIRELENILRSKADWILTKLQSAEALAAAPVELADGANLLLLGNDITLNLKYDLRSKQPMYEQGILTISLPNPDDQSAILKKILQWYRKQALIDFERRLAIFAVKLGFEKPELFLSNAKGRWGSCNSKREIRMNWRLIQAPPHLINYVICHELAHLKEMNHSAKFWAIVESICPDYKVAEKDLKAWSNQLHAIS